jgi:hypothetical protein
MTNVVQFPSGPVGDGVVVNVSDVLDGMKHCERVFVIGVDEHGDLEMASSHGNADACFLLVRAMKNL